MRKELIILLAFVLLLASCSSGPVTPGNQRTFIGGTTGLLINFVEGEPPMEVTDNGATPFTVSVKLENKGETTIPIGDATFILKGFDAGDFGVTNSQLTLTTTEEILKNDINPDTGEPINSPPIYVTWPELNFGGSLSGNHAFPFMVDVCYKYQTIANAPLCIKEKLMDQDASICLVSGTKTVENSGAPIQITEFEEFTAGADAISFSFKVKNMGNGAFSRKASGCDEIPANINFVRLTVDSGMSGLTCSGLSNPTTSGTAYSGDAKLSTGERSVRCTQPLTANDKTDKIKIVEIFIDYDYLESALTNVLVKHI